jgi:hypothetical protein
MSNTSVKKLDYQTVANDILMNSKDTEKDLIRISIVSGEASNRIINQIGNQVSYEVAIKLIRGIRRA